jgi:hypothetical protein
MAESIRGSPATALERRISVAEIAVLFAKRLFGRIAIKKP